MSPASKAPLIPVCIFVSGLSMVGPAAVSLAADDASTARMFFYTGLLVAVFAGIFGLATLRLNGRAEPAHRLLQFAAILVGLPAILAIPVFAAVGSAGVIDTYFEMVSCLTTTGASAIQELPPPAAAAVNDLTGATPLPIGVAFWRAQVAWMGGLMMWLAAAEIFAPLNAGGFEIVAPPRQFSGLPPSGSATTRGPRPRKRGALRLAALYFGLTAALWGLLVLTGDPPVAALIGAMSALSTSGITAEGGFSAPAGGLAGEIFVCAFLVLALSRVPVSTVRWGTEYADSIKDRETKLALALVFAAVAVMLWFQYPQLAALRTWSQLSDVAFNVWGAVFTTVSFLTTAGFKSLHFDAAIGWQPPEFVKLTLLGAAMIGGGIATTAGGLRLLRVAELIRFGVGEVSRMAFPSSVLKAPEADGGARGDTALLAGMFLILFILLAALFSAGLGAAGFSFEEATTVSVAALTSAGPLAYAVLGPEFGFGDASGAVKLMLCVAMIVGRLELLALISLLNPEIWRRL